MQPRASLPELLQSHAGGQPSKRAYTFLDEHGEEVAELTYGELHLRALAVARRLLRHCRSGDRALLIFPPGLDFIVAYFGCLYAEVVAVPVNPPRRSRVQDATGGIVRDCEPAAVLTVAAMAEASKPFLDSLGGTPHWISVDEPDDAADCGFRPKAPAADSLAFLQYTSGSTSAPKGVMVTHGNLVANQEMIRRAFGHDENSTVVGWAPLFHDQGLIGNVLQPLYVGAGSVLMSPMAFIRWPLLWPAAISRYRAHSSGGPNFAFDACVTALKATIDRVGEENLPELDLSSWKVAFNGAEPIRHETLRRFHESFAPYGFSERTLYPCYGLAEATLLVAGSQKGRGPRTLEADPEELAHRRYVAAPDGGGSTLTGSGLVLPDEEVRIVDPETRLPCPEHRAGEIWVAGGHVAQGYWKNPEATAETFRAECEGEPGRRYLRTGDLGMVIDGELYVVGRLKELIIIRGRNHYPQDVEHTVQSAHPAVKPGAGAAFPVPGPDGDRLVVVQEVRRDHRLKADPKDVAGSVREAVVREHELSVSLVLILPGQLQKTSSGKIMRTAARNRYLEGGFKVWEREELPSA